MLSDELQREQAGSVDESVTLGAWAEDALQRASARAQSWYATVRAYRRAYAMSRHFRRFAD